MPGFSLAEVVVCLGILALALVVSVTLFLSMFRSAEKSSHNVSGVMVAETVMTQVLHDIFLGLRPGLTKADFFANNSPPSPPLSGSLVLSNTEYQYEMDYATVTSTTGTDLGAGLSGNRLKVVTVTCWWWGPTAASQRAGQGRLSVQIRRLVNENARF